jgi:isocitrate/isopropylmalate dehydrogenase
VFHITAKGIANPVGRSWTAAEMVKWLGHEEAAEGLLTCVENICEAGVKMRDLGGSARDEGRYGGGL